MLSQITAGHISHLQNEDEDENKDEEKHNEEEDEYRDCTAKIHWFTV